MYQLTVLRHASPALLEHIQMYLVQTAAQHACSAPLHLEHTAPQDQLPPVVLAVLRATSVLVKHLTRRPVVLVHTPT